MTEVASLIADLVRAGVDPELIGRTAAALASREAVKVVDEQAERRRAADRERKRLRNSAESAHTVSPKKETSPTPPKEKTTPSVVSEPVGSSTIRPETDKSAPASSSPSVIDLPATLGQFVAITEADVAEWRDAFPAVDVPQQLRAMRQWLLANERNRKTVRGMRKFIVSWLSRDQDRGGSRPHQGQQSQAPPRKSAFQQHQDDCQREIDRVLGRKTDDEFTGNTLDLGARDYRAH